ncbi:MAG TPA: Crp/Fnr family transcriptional regulator [Trebonia sp.]|nr:Crp/Fnr family transcriptional regulator [Trebonia sp.]
MMKITAAALAGQRSLRGLEARHLETLAATATEVLFPARHRIFADGEYADKFWLVESGYVLLDVHVPGEGLAVIGRVGIGGLLGWSWLLPPYQRVSGAVCVTEVRAVEFNALTVRDRCAADPVLRDELTRRLFQVAAGRLRDTRTRLVTADFWSSCYDDAPGRAGRALGPAA